MWYNLGCILLCEIIWGVGVAMSHRDTVMASYLKFQGMPSVVVALIPIIFTLGLTAVQPISATWLGHSDGRGKRLAVIYLIMAACTAAMGGWILASESMGMLWRMGPYFAGYVGAMCCLGLGEPLWASLICQTASEQMRGRIFTLMIATLGLGGVLGGWITKAVMAQTAAPASFGWLTLATGILMAIACAPLAAYRDSQLASPEAPPTGLGSLLRRGLPGCLAQSRFRFYIAVNVGLWVLTTSAPFLANYIKSELPGESESIVGDLTMVMYGVMTVGSPVAGWIADRVGFRLFLVCGLLVVASAYAGMALVPMTKTSALVLYGTAMLSWPVLIVGGTPFVTRIMPQVRVTELVAMVSVMTCLPRVAIPLTLGRLRDWTQDYAPLLYSVAGIAVLTAVMVHLAAGRRTRPGS